MDYVEVQAKVAEWTRSHWKGDQRCPRCLGNNWAIKPIVALPSEEPHSEYPFLHLPVVPYGCRECGYLIFLDALVLGLVPRASDD